MNKKTIINILLINLFLIIILFSCNNKKKTNNIQNNNDENLEKPVYQEKYINSISGLVLRENPLKNKKRIDVIPFGEKVKIIETNEDIVKIGNKSGKWVRVLWGGLSGWVFDGYLSVDKPSKPLSKFERHLIKGAWSFYDDTMKFYENNALDIKYLQMYHGPAEYAPEPMIGSGHWSYDKESNIFKVKDDSYGGYNYFKVVEWDNEQIKLFNLINKYEFILHKTEEINYYEY